MYFRSSLDWSKRISFSQKSKRFLKSNARDFELNDRNLCAQWWSDSRIETIDLIPLDISIDFILDDQGIRQLKGSTSTEHNESPFEAMQGLDSLLESTSYPDSRQYFNNTTLSEQQTICGSPTLLQTNCFTFDLKESKKPNDSGLSMNTNDANISFQHLTPGFRPASIWLQNLDHSQELKGANLNFDNNSTISNISILSDNREMFYENQPKFYPKAKFPVKFECGDGVTFAPKSVFEPYSAFGQNCSFGGGCTFGEFCSFGSNARFGALSKFGSDCMFGQMCVFAKKCVFGTNCSWGGYCRLEDGCCAVAGVFESSCRFVGSVELSNCRFASCFDTDYDICR